MLLRTFTARTAAEAMAQVRRALGDEAIILSTQDDDDGGVRITAALEPTETASAPHSATAPATELEAADRVADVLDHHRVPRGLADRILHLPAGPAAGDWTIAFAAAPDHTLSFKALRALGPARHNDTPPGRDKGRRKSWDGG